eukprot:TRINITY_DN30850_c0_g1_i1.p1 TRINITY_DN30850_c0_g1~~TRINITY_DN30850_c0_g1_i1.p1  ORF type:complete len:299 (+),score=60.99 TRINITY_DN30850_c0_g1_i1:47-898(+)
MDDITAMLEDLGAKVEGYECHANMDMVRADKVTPCAVVACYLVMVWLGPKVVGEGLPRGVTRPAFAVWNLCLSVFSWCGLYACGMFVVSELAMLAGQGNGLEETVQHMVCSDEMIFRKPGGACYGAVGFAAAAFTFSKFVELGDTFFLIIMGKKIEFLQWWHHATVLLYCWVAFGEKTPSALIFGTMNYFVHSIMYLYFAVSQYSTIMRPFRSLITILQLSQMVVGTAVVCLTYYFKSTATCSPSYTTWYFTCCGVMYVSYLILFLKLFLDSYVFKTRKVKTN